MDLNFITSMTRASSRETLASFAEGDAWLAGGTALFSAPGVHLRRLRDLGETGWEPLTEHADGRLEIAATCTVARLAAHPEPLFGRCARAFLASFTVWNAATVGGNLCAALPAGPMIALTAALEGECLLLHPDGSARTLPVTDLVVGDGRTALRDGELLRSVTVAPPPARTSVRQASLSALGRSAVLLVGTRAAGGATTLTITAATPRPHHLRFPAPPGADQLRAAIGDAVEHWFDDLHGDPAWRRHMTFRLAEEIREELS